MFEGWENFYLLLGGASGSLIGLLFIVITLMAGRTREQTLQGASVYMTPLVFALAAVLVFSGTALAPHVEPGLVGLVMGGGGLGGLGYGLWIMLRFRKLNLGEQPHWTDWWCYCVAPVVLSTLLVIAASTVWLDQALAPRAIAVVLMLMLLMAIRNAWDLVTWLAPGSEAS